MVGMLSRPGYRQPVICGDCREPIERVYYGAQGESFERCGCDSPRELVEGWEEMLAAVDVMQRQRASFEEWQLAHEHLRRRGMQP